MKDKNTNMYILAMVGTVALVGIVVMLMGNGTMSTTDLTGQPVAPVMDVEVKAKATTFRSDGLGVVAIPREQHTPTDDDYETRCWDNDAREDVPHEVASYAAIQIINPDGSITSEEYRMEDYCIESPSWPKEVMEQTCRPDNDHTIFTIRTECDHGCTNGRCT